MKKIDARDPLSRLIAPYRGLGPSLWSMFLATMVNRFGDFVGAFLSLYLSRALGYDAARTGVVVSLAFASSMVGSLVSGRIADSIGRKRALIAFQTTGAIFTLATGFLFRQAWAPWLIIAGNLFRGGARPLISALLTDLAPQGRRKEVFGLQYWSINVGVALGPLAAGFLFDHALAWLFWGDGLSTLLAVSLIATGVHPPKVVHGESELEKADERGALRAFLARPILVAFGLVSVLNSITYSQTGFGLPLTLSQALGAEGPRFSGYMMSLNALTVITLSIPIARALRGLSPLACLSLSGLFYVVGFGAYAFPLGRAGFAAATFVWTIGEIVSSTNMGVFLAKHTPENWRGSFQSFQGVFYAGGSSLGPLVAGPLLAAQGPRGLWLATVALCGLWSILAFLLSLWDRRTGIRAAEERRVPEGAGQ
jgi:MFS family permease